MRCRHCGYSCGPVGRDMSLRTFKAALAIVEERGGQICLGGGEPTLHPLFWDFVAMAIVVVADNYGREDAAVSVITNGSRYHTAMALLRMADANVVYAELSLDKYHNSRIVRRQVKEAYTAAGRVRQVGPVYSAAGRAVENGLFVNDDCICDDLFVSPDGSMRWCGCPDSPSMGTVFSPDAAMFEKYDDDPEDSCYHKHVAIVERKKMEKLAKEREVGYAPHQGGEDRVQP